MASPVRVWLPIIVLLGDLLLAASAQSAPYVIDGFTLGERVAAGSSNYQSYACKPHDNLAGATWCERAQNKSAKGASATLSNALIHAPDGTVIYATATTAPVSLTKSTAQGEVDALSRNFNDRPARVEWQPLGNGVTTASLIAIWGPIKLEDFSDDADVAPEKNALIVSVGGAPVYRITGGRGYVYAASFDASGRGQRQYAAVDATELASRYYQVSLAAILQKDQSLAKDDYKLWPDVAALTRSLSLDTSPKIANDALDKVFDKQPSKKLWSHVWSLIPGGAIERLGDNLYSRIDQYGPKTEHPDVRRNIQSFLAGKPSDPFIEFAYYIVGDFDGALKANPNSIIGNALHYGSGYKIIQSLLEDALKIVGRRTAQNTPAAAKDQLKSLLDGGPDAEYYVDDSLRISNRYPELYDHKPLGNLIPNFAARAAAAQPHFEAVLRDDKSVHADDAAYMLGWLAFHEGKSDVALAYFSRAMTVGNGDFKPAAMKQAVRIIEQHPAREQFTMVAADRGFSQQPALWYVAARSAYRQYDYASTIDVAQRALTEINAPMDRLPQTTDPDKIEAALEKISPDLSSDPNALELPYLIEASKEISDYIAFLNSAATERPDVFAKRARAIIQKYSMLVDQKQLPGRARLPPVLAHRDIRQAMHMIELTLASTPKDAPHGPLREWLHYRKVRILAVTQPEAAAAEVAAMAQEFPNSALLDDALAEELYGEGLVMRNLPAAQKTFRKIVDTYPNGNAVDNAYTWMAIILRCVGHTDEAQNMNREIIRRFPLSRHARYAKERLANPTACHASDQ